MKEFLAYVLIVPVIAPILAIDKTGEVLISLGSFMEDKVAEPYCEFWKDIFKVANKVSEGKEIK